MLYFICGAQCPTKGKTGTDHASLFGRQKLQGIPVQALPTDHPHYIHILSEVGLAQVNGVHVRTKVLISLAETVVTEEVPVNKQWHIDLVFSVGSRCKVTILLKCLVSTLITHLQTQTFLISPRQVEQPVC